jgi:spermidine/putrescine transport system substrate-binding protein
MPITRREFLRTAAAVAGPTVAGSLIAACATGRSARRRIPLVRQDRPIAWGIHDDNLPIRSDLPVERGATLRIYEWRQYLSNDVLDSFVRRYEDADVTVQTESFESREAAVARLSRPDARFDVFFPTVDQIGGLVEARLLQPLNHDYLPNLRNLWPQFSPSAGPRPFYDQGLGYTIPYTVFATGIGWRTDLVARADGPDRLRNPYDVFWNPAYRGRVGLYDSYREVIGMALLHDGVRDVNTRDAVELAEASRALEDLVRVSRVAFTTEGAYEGLPNGQFALHQAWSGDILSALRWGRAEALGTAPSLRYFWPSDGAGVVGCDLVAVCAGAESPVLAHAFLNHLLDTGVALRNFAWNGYQPPIAEATPQALFAPRSQWRRTIPSNLRSAVLTPADYARGRFLLALDPAADAEWLRAWESFRTSSRSQGR